MYMWALSPPYLITFADEDGMPSMIGQQTVSDVLGMHNVEFNNSLFYMGRDWTSKLGRNFSCEQISISYFVLERE